VESYQEVYLRAKRLLEEQSDELLPELDRVLSAAERDTGERLERTLRLAEMALVAKLDPWWTGPPQKNIRAAVGKLHRHVHDPLALGLALRLAVGYARAGRLDDDAHRLATLAERLRDTGLPFPESGYAEEAGRTLEEAAWLPSATYAYQLVKDETPAEVFERARAQLARGNASCAAILVEMRLVRQLDDWYVGPPLPNVEAALATYQRERPPELQELAVLLARAYVRGGFVDLRARDHVLALVRGEEAKLLGPEEAIGFQDYVDRECFDFPYAHLYEQVKQADPDAIRSMARKFTANGSLSAAQRLCEMALVRRFDDWYVGAPDGNVRSAVARYLAASELADQEPDPDADWTASFLAGLYAATLEGASHARRLVHALVARGASPVFVEAMQGAGIPEDVTVEELHQLYRDSVEVEARVAAFRALAEDAGGLSDYEQQAYEEVLRFLEQGERSVVEEVTQTIGALVEVVASDALVRSVTAVIEDALRLAVSGANAALRKDRLLGELARRDPNLRSLERIRTADLSLLDEVAWSQTLQNRVVATLEGLGCGLGGPTLVLLDLPMLILVNLNAVASVATCYGFDVDTPAERDFMVGLLAGGPQALRRVVAQGEEGGRDQLADVSADHLTSNRAALALHAGASRIASRLARQKLLQVLPILGGAMGAGLNFHFTYTTSRTAVMAYRYRWLLRRFLDSPS
jgi:hypothetical protein